MIWGFSLLAGGRIWKAAAMAGLLALLVLAVRDWGAARRARADLKICAAAADGRKPLDGCPAKVSVAIAAARAAAACEAALAKPDPLGVRTNCKPAVQDRVARLAVAEANLADARRQLAQAEQQTIAAVSRAEARAKSTTERKARAKAAIAAAPTDAAGVIRCDAGCLHDIAGGSARADR